MAIRVIDPAECEHRTFERQRDVFSNISAKHVRELCKGCGTVLFEHDVKRNANDK